MGTNPYQDPDAQDEEQDLVQTAREARAFQTLTESNPDPNMNHLNNHVTKLDPTMGHLNSHARAHNGRKR